MFSFGNPKILFLLLLIPAMFGLFLLARKARTKKLKRYGYESTIENMVKYVNDIAGIRIICSFTSDIYRIADMIENQRDIKGE